MSDSLLCKHPDRMMQDPDAKAATCVLLLLAITKEIEMAFLHYFDFPIFVLKYLDISGYKIYLFFS